MQVRNGVRPPVCLCPSLVRARKNPRSASDVVALLELGPDQLSDGGMYLTGLFRSTGLWISVNSLISSHHLTR